MLDEKEITATGDENATGNETAFKPTKNRIKKNSTSETKSKRQARLKDDNASAGTDSFTESADQPESESKLDDNILDAPSFDSLIIDDSPISSADKTEDGGGFEEFLADYKSAIKKTLSAAKSAFGKNSSEDEKSEDADEEANESEQYTSVVQDESTPQLSLDIGDEFIPVEDNDVVDPSESKNTYDPKNPRIIDNVFDFVELFVFTLAAVLIITTFFFKHTIVDGPSMMNTLQHQEHLIISDTFYKPERGDIIVFQDVDTTRGEPWVKRIIGLPGETVEVKVNNIGEYMVYINGEYLEEDYAYNSLDKANVFGGPWVVGEDEVFVMGDNRHNSTDSRVIGPIKIDSILGKVLLRIYPFDKFGNVD